MSKAPPYYRPRNGRAFFELGRARAEKSGMRASYPLGKHGEDAKVYARELYNEYCRAMMLPSTPPQVNYKRGSLGHWFVRFKEKERFKKLSETTKKEYDDYWKYIGPALGNETLTKINPSQFERFHLAIEAEHGENVRWHTVKVARSIFNAAVKYHILERSPCLALQNTKPAPRTSYWLSQEVRHLISTAEQNGYVAMALGIRLAWETLMAPVDIRTLTLESLKNDGSGPYVETTRSKTGKPVYAVITKRLESDILAYAEALPVIIKPGTPFLRTTRSLAIYKRVRFTDEFAKVRAIAFGSDEKRKMMDIRRSGNLEADLGGASAQDRAEILANALDKDSRLDETYTPLTVAKARRIAKQREQGRAIFHAESMKRKNNGV